MRYVLLEPTLWKVPPSVSPVVLERWQNSMACHLALHVFKVGFQQATETRVCRVMSKACIRLLVPTLARGVKQGSVPTRVVFFVPHATLDLTQTQATLNVPHVLLAPRIRQPEGQKFVNPATTTRPLRPAQSFVTPVATARSQAMTWFIARAATTVNSKPPTTRALPVLMDWSPTASY